MSITKPGNKKPCEQKPHKLRRRDSNDEQRKDQRTNWWAGGLSNGQLVIARAWEGIKPPRMIGENGTACEEGESLVPGNRLGFRGRWGEGRRVCIPKNIAYGRHNGRRSRKSLSCFKPSFCCCEIMIKPSVQNRWISFCCFFPYLNPFGLTNFFTTCIIIIIFVMVLKKRLKSVHLFWIWGRKKNAEAPTMATSPM